MTILNQIHDNYDRGPFGQQKGVRGNQYKPKVMKRIRTHGLLTRFQTRGGKQMIWRKILEGPSGWTRLAPAP